MQQGESEEHLNAKKFVQALLIARLWEAVLEKPAHQFTILGLKEWQYDVFSWKLYKGLGFITLAIEIDGKIGHSTEKAVSKGKFRDEQSLLNKKVYTIRLKTEWVVGVKKLDVETLIAEIEYQLEYTYGMKIKI